MTEDAQAPPPPPPPPPAAPDPPPPPAAPGPPPPSGSGPSEDRTIWIVLSYLWILALIPFLMEKDDKEVQWHAKHGLVISAAELALWIALWVLANILGPLACLGCFPALIVLVGIIVFHVVCIIKGLDGERMLVPGLSEFADRF